MKKTLLVSAVICFGLCASAQMRTAQAPLSAFQGDATSKEILVKQQQTEKKEQEKQERIKAIRLEEQRRKKNNSSKTIN